MHMAPPGGYRIHCSGVRLHPLLPNKQDVLGVATMALSPF